MKTSRQRVLEYIQAHYPLTATDLSRALRMTEANARHHLAILQSRGLVQAAGFRLPQGKGRPAQLFMPSETTLGHNLDQLTSALLEFLRDSKTPIEQEATLRKLAASLAGRSLTSNEKGEKVNISLTRRLNQTVSLLNTLHYQARWEAWRGAPRLILGHCPYAAIIQGHPELCRLDAYLLQELSQAHAHQTGKLTSDDKGALHCIFQIEESRIKT